MDDETRPNLDRVAILADYTAGPDRLAAAIRGLSDEDLDLACPAAEVGTWSIRQLAHHIVDGDDLWKTPIKMALGQPPDVFSLDWYWSQSQDEWASCWAYARRGVAVDLAMFRANREHIRQLIEHVPGAWESAVRVRWPDGRVERVTVEAITRMQAGHAFGHVDDIVRIRREHAV